MNRIPFIPQNIGEGHLILLGKSLDKFFFKSKVWTLFLNFSMIYFAVYITYTNYTWWCGMKIGRAVKQSIYFYV